MCKKTPTISSVIFSFLPELRFCRRRKVSWPEFLCHPICVATLMGARRLDHCWFSGTWPVRKSRAETRLPYGLLFLILLGSVLQTGKRVPWLRLTCHIHSFATGNSHWVSLLCTFKYSPAGDLKGCSFFVWAYASFKITLFKSDFI